MKNETLLCIETIRKNLKHEMLNLKFPWWFRSSIFIKSHFSEFSSILYFHNKLFFWNFYVKINLEISIFVFRKKGDNHDKPSRNTREQSIRRNGLWIFSTSSASTESSYWGVWWASHVTYWCKQENSNSWRAVLSYTKHGAFRFHVRP